MVMQFLPNLYFALTVFANIGERCSAIICHPHPVFPITHFNASTGWKLRSKIVVKIGGGVSCTQLAFLTYTSIHPN